MQFENPGTQITDNDYGMRKKMDKGDEVVHWDETFHDCLSNNIKHPKMLDKDGLILNQRCKLAGKELRGEPASLRKVLFDKNYLLHYLKKQVWEVLDLFTEEQVFELLKEAKDFDKDSPLTGLKVYKLHGREVVRIEDLKP